MTSNRLSLPRLCLVGVMVIPLMVDAMPRNSQEQTALFTVSCIDSDSTGKKEKRDSDFEGKAETDGTKQPDKKCVSCEVENTGRWNGIQKDSRWNSSTVPNDTFSLLGLSDRRSLRTGKSERDQMDLQGKSKLYTFLRKIMFHLFYWRKHHGKTPRRMSPCVRRFKTGKSCRRIRNREFRERCHAYKARMKSIDRLRQVRGNLAAEASGKLGTVHGHTVTEGMNRKHNHDWLDRLAHYYDRCSNLDAAAVDRTGRLKLFVGNYVIKMDKHNREEAIAPVTPRKFTAGRKISLGRALKRMKKKSVLKRIISLAKDGVDAVGKREGELYFIHECSITSFRGTLKGSVAISLKAIGLPCDVDAAWGDPTNGALVVAKDDRLWYWMPRRSRVEGPYDSNLVLGLSSTALCPAPKEVRNVEEMLTDAMRKELQDFTRRRSDRLDADQALGRDRGVDLQNQLSSSTHAKGGQLGKGDTVGQNRNGRLIKTRTKIVSLELNREEEERKSPKDFKENFTSGKASANPEREAVKQSTKETETTHNSARRKRNEHNPDNLPLEEENREAEDEDMVEAEIAFDEPELIDDIDEEEGEGHGGWTECLHPETAYVDGEGILVLTEGNKYYKIDKQNKEIDTGNIHSLFENIPWNPEAALALPGKTVFYKGDEIATYQNGKLSVSSLPIYHAKPVDAVATHDDVQYALSRCELYTYNGEGIESTAHAHDLNLPCDVDAAWSNRESGSGSMTLLKGDLYWVWPSFHRAAIGPFKANNVFQLKSLKFCS